MNTNIEIEKHSVRKPLSFRVKLQDIYDLNLRLIIHNNTIDMKIFETKLLLKLLLLKDTALNNKITTILI